MPDRGVAANGPTEDGAERAPARRWTVVLDGNAPSAALIGGKGASLDRLVGAGLPVPSTGAVTAAVDDELRRDRRVNSVLAAIRRDEPISDDAIDQAFLAASLPTSIEAAITQLAQRVGGTGRLAIRSSATTEDAATFSFAGQYRSVLDVDATDEAAVLRAVRLVFASLWHHAPVNYRRVVGLSNERPAMAAIVMRMVPAREAGVVFTVDPTSDGRELARVEVVAGAGEALVSGRTTPRIFRLRRDGSGERPAPAHVLRALELAQRVEADAGVAQDVEWVWDSEQVWLVQARPITTLTRSIGELDEPDEADERLATTELTTAGIAEMLPGVLPPLRWDLCSFLVEEAFRRLLNGLRVLPADLVDAEGLLHRVRGRAALDYTQLAAMAASLPGGAAEEMEQRYFAPEQAGTGRAPHRTRPWRSAAHDLRVGAMRRRAINDADVSIGVARRLIGHGAGASARGSAAARSTTVTPAGLAVRLLRLVDAAARAMAAELAVAADAAAAYGRLEHVLCRRLDAGRAARLAGLLTAGAVQPAIPADASAAVFAGPTWCELGAEPAAIVARDHGDAMEALTDALRESGRWNAEDWRSRLYLRSIRRLADEAVEQLSRREATKAAVLVMGGEVRRLVLSAGETLARDGSLVEPDDVELLRLAELLRALRSGATPDAVTLRRRRRRLRQAEADGPLPLRFTGHPVLEPAPTDRPHHRLHGVAASAGRHVGRARVVTSPNDALAADEVLVAQATDPSWSPLLVRAGAVVLERGGPLSHAAIVARELGVPAVLDVPGAVTALAGRLVLVDGDRGVVTVIEESTAAPEAETAADAPAADDQQEEHR